MRECQGPTTALNRIQAGVINCETFWQRFLALGKSGKQRISVGTSALGYGAIEVNAVVSIRAVYINRTLFLPPSLRLLLLAFVKGYKAYEISSRR